MSLMDYIGEGKDHAIKRSDLVKAIGLPDRAVRQMIEDARTQGEIIINDGSGRGYYTSQDLNDLRKQYRMNHSRAMSILVQQKHLRKKIKQMEENQC